MPGQSLPIGTDARHPGDRDPMTHASPPLTEITWRVIYAASSVSRKLTAAATSSGLPMRRAGMSFSASSSGTSPIIRFRSGRALRNLP